MNRKMGMSIIILCFIASFSLVGAETDIAILVRGPVKSTGFPLLYPNAMDIWTGYYRYKESEVIVSFTREDIFIPDEWEFAVCDELEGFSPEENSFYYRSNDWSLLFQFSDSIKLSLHVIPIDNVRVPLAGTLPTDQCTFINKFITRLKYFLRNADPKDPPLLPAILEFN